MPRSRSGLWVEIALALALLTLTTIVLNAGVFWLLIKKTEEQRRTDLALSLTSALGAQLSVAAEREAEGRATAMRRVVAAYEGAALDIDELYVVGMDMQVIARLAGEPSVARDAGFRAAIFGHKLHSEVQGNLLGRRWVVTTAPVAPKGSVVGAVRVRMPLRTPLLPGGPAGFVLSYTVLSGGLIALFGFSLFQRRLLVPVAALKDGTERIAAGDFGHELKVDAAIELEELCEALNAMRLSLADYRARTADQLQRLASANEDLQHAQEALIRSEKLAGVGRLAAGLAHEIGNPLAAVIGSVELLQQGLGNPVLEADLLARGRRELDRIHLIIRQLLDYARVGDGSLQQVSLAEAVGDAFATVRLQSSFRSLTLALDGPTEPLWVRIEPEKLHQALVNLLTNSGDAINAGGGSAVRIALGATREGLATVRCEDDGPGFGELALERGLEPFFTTKEPGQGTGLGLALCLQVAENAGGTLRISNLPGGGAVVELMLPTVGPVAPDV